MTTNTIIRTSATSLTGYEIVFDDKVISIDKTYPNEPTTLILPENPSNRKYFSSKKVDAAGGEIELTFKETRTLGSRTESSAPRKGLEEYLDEDDKALYLALVEKAKKNREQATKKVPLTPLEKAQRAVERAMANLQKVQNGEM